jgi:hypothetical protein
VPPVLLPGNRTMADEAAKRVLSLVDIVRGVEDGTLLPEGTCRRCRGMGVVFVGDGFGGREGVRCPECMPEASRG